MYIAIIEIIIIVIGVAYSIILHEIAHGLTAYWFGDETAKNAKRISLNPLRHIDPLGTIVVPLTLFIFGFPIYGWAKPVPINPLNFKNYKLGMIVVSIAGVFVNFVIMIFMFFLFSIFKLYAFLGVASLNLVLFVFNLLPFPPLDGFNFFSMFLPDNFRKKIYKYRDTFIVIFLLLIVSGGIKFIYFPIYRFFLEFFLKIFSGGTI